MNRWGKRPIRTISRRFGGPTLVWMRAYVLAELGDRLAVDVYVRKEDAFEALEDATRNEPSWAGILFVAPIELEERNVSPN